jgi:hypothetical protein
MKNTAVIWVLILALSPLVNAANLRVQDGRPIVDGVFVNGHGPYRFLVDTGTNVNLIDANLARSIGLNATFQVDLASATGKVPTPGSDGNEIVLDGVKAGGQKFLYSGLEAIHNFAPDIQGVLGQWFLPNSITRSTCGASGSSSGSRSATEPAFRFRRSTAAWLYPPVSAI